MNEEQQLAFDWYKSGRTFLITGGAGTGKSYVLKQIIEDLYCRFPSDQYGKNDIPYAITSLTGVSSLYIGGQTLHSWAGIRLGEGDVKQLLKCINKMGKVPRWRNVRVLIIDEVSMLDIELFSKLHEIGCQLRRNNNSLFGGIQVIFAGDFLQLPPVSGNKFCFSSRYWKQYVKDVVYLKKVIRQKDVTFQQLLNRFRIGVVTEDDKKLLNSRLVSKVPSAINGVKPTKLFPFKRNVADINEREYLRLVEKGKVVKKFMPKYDIKWHPRKDLSTSTQQRLLLQNRQVVLNELVRNHNERGIIWTQAVPGSVSYNERMDLCVGAQVMLTVNRSLEEGLVNGSRGVIVGFNEYTGYPEVRFDNGVQVVIEPYEYEHYMFDYTVIVKQVPLILAWALTIHKVQSATLSFVVTDLAYVFSAGQTYVALSRVQSLEGLYLLAIDYNKIWADKRALKYNASLGWDCILQYLPECKSDPFCKSSDGDHPDVCRECLILFLLDEIWPSILPAEIVTKIVDYI